MLLLNEIAKYLLNFTDPTLILLAKKPRSNISLIFSVTLLSKKKKTNHYCIGNNKKKSIK